MTGQSEYSVGEIKRFLELWWAGDEMRQLLCEHHAEATDRYGCLPTRVEMAPFIDPDRRSELADENLRADFRAYSDFGKSKFQHLATVREQCRPSDTRFEAWRGRQMGRNRMVNGITVDHALPHIPFAIEICRGCSVGCWYCGCDAGPLEAIFRYGEEEAELYRGILRILRKKLGPAARFGSSYWATDPLDNPDYERFMDDFHEICGMYPQTTTARPDADIDRTRRLLRVSQAKGRFINRFSIQSLRQLDVVMRGFTADELVRVELVPQFPQGVVAKANAGRFFRHAVDKPHLIEKEVAKIRRLREEKGQPAPEEMVTAGTNSCMSGFWINLVDRFMRLVSPTSASEQWPGGWILFEEVSFRDAEELEEKVEGLIERHMPSSLPSYRNVAFTSGLDFAPTERGFTVRTPHAQFALEAPEGRAPLTGVGDLIRSGNRHPEEICFLARMQYGTFEADAQRALDECFERGLLREEPEVNFFEQEHIEGPAKKLRRVGPIASRAPA